MLLVDGVAPFFQWEPGKLSTKDRRPRTTSQEGSISGLVSRR
jgi:hypothetical protein